MENTVENMMLAESALDDAAQAQNEGESLSSLVTEQAPTQDDTPPAQEPGWIKQRVNKAVTKAVAEARAALTAEYEAMLAPIRESVMDRQAQELVQSGEFKSLERAKEYVRLKGGVPIEQPAQPQDNTPRDAQGRFQAKDDPTTRARADLLARQAQKIKTNRGVDVMQAFNSDPGIQQRILSGEWDFYDVADHLDAGRQPRRSVPAPMRTPNGARMNPVSIANMSDEQFERLQRNLASGTKYDLTK